MTYTETNNALVTSTSGETHSSSCLHNKKGMVLYSAVSSPLDRSKRFTLSSPGRPVHSDTVLGFSWKHSSHAAIAQRLFTHISTTVYSQVLIYTAESTEGDVKRKKMPKLRHGSKWGFEPGLSRLRVRHSTTELPRSTTYLVYQLYELTTIAMTKYIIINDYMVISV